MIKTSSVLSRFSFSLMFLATKGFAEASVGCSKEIFQYEFQNTVVSVNLGDLTEETTDVIVNAANSDLLHGGGVAGAIRVKGGNSIQAESNAYVRKNGRVKTGQVAITKAGDLKCKSIIHAVGPIWKGGSNNEVEDLRSCLLNSLEKANENSYKSISIPAISTGIYGFPKELAASIFAKTIFDYLSKGKTSLTMIRLIDRSDITVNLWVQELKHNFKD